MKIKLLRYLCCPQCKSDFKVLVNKKIGEEIISGFLVCKKCQRKYPVIRGIPVILEQKRLKDFEKTKKNWENWWKKIRNKSDIDVYD